jgi:Domain of unknown function (DUF4192)
VVPYLLGFHPIESLVALFFDQGRVRLTARMDLPPESAGPALVAEIRSLAQRAGAASVVFLVYSEQPAGRVLLEQVVAETGLEPLEALLVSPERWWSALCPGEAGCCPSEGTPYDLSGHPLCAEAVLAGLNAFGDRAELATMVAGPPDSDCTALEDLGLAKVLALIGVDQSERRLRLRVLVEAGLADPDRLSDADCAEMGALCLDVNVRDVAWAMMTRDDAAIHLTLWRRVLSRSVDDLASAPLGLVGMAAWISGNGALLNCSIDRLTELDPDYGLLSICRDISWRAIHPSLWDKMSADMRADPALFPALVAGL